MVGSFSEDFFTFSKLPAKIIVVVLTLLSSYIINHPVCVASLMVAKVSKTIVTIAISFAKKTLLMAILLKQIKIKGYQYLKSQLNAVSKF